MVALPAAPAGLARCRGRCFHVSILLCFHISILAGCHRKPPPPQAPPAEPEQAETFEQKIAMEARGITWTLPDQEGRPIWEMKASKGGGAAAKGLAELEDVQCRVYSEGKPALDAKAARVRADYNAKRLALLGGVAAKTPDGKRSFRSERVTLSVKEEKRAVLEAAGTVRLEVDGVAMAGARLVTNPRLSEGQLLPE